MRVFYQQIQYRFLFAYRLGCRDYIPFIQRIKKLGSESMKDYWQSSKKSYIEPAAYRMLQEKGTSHITTAVAGGDAGDQKTVTYEYLKERMKLLERVHCHFVFKELARPLGL
jgi:hypothetical protein